VRAENSVRLTPARTFRARWLPDGRTTVSGASASIGSRGLNACARGVFFVRSLKFRQTRRSRSSRRVEIPATRLERSRDEAEHRRQPHQVTEA
jgi:hypothetical protein